MYRDQCTTQYEQKCTTQYKEEVEYYTETECNTDYKEDCQYQWEGTGNNKVCHHQKSIWTFQTEPPLLPGVGPNTRELYQQRLRQLRRCSEAEAEPGPLRELRLSA